MKKISNNEVMRALLAIQIEYETSGFHHANRDQHNELLNTIKEAYTEQQEELTLYRELDLDYLIRCLNMHDYGDDELYTKMYDLLIKIKGDEKE